MHNLTLRPGIRAASALLSTAALLTDASADTAVYQDDVPDPITGAAYDGVEDAGVVKRPTPDPATQNFGARADMNTGDRESVPVLENVLIRFDITSLAGQFQTINSATLRLRFSSAPTEPGFVDAFLLAPINGDWEEGPGVGSDISNSFPGTVTWNEKIRGTQGSGLFPDGTGTEWAGGRTGAGTPDVDHVTPALATATIAGTESVDQAVDFVVNNLTVIEDWIAGTNPGLVLISRDIDSLGLRWHSSEAASQAMKPELIIDYSNIPAPDIAVEHPVGTDLTDDAEQIMFGIHPVGVPSLARTFTIRNEGSLDLTGLVVTKSGSEAAEFAVDTAGMATTLMTGEETTFDVIFTAGDTGPRTATLEIASNDANENPFEIDVVGGPFGSPGVTSGTLILELDSRRDVVESGGVVSAWNDQSSFGNHLTSAGSQQPTVETAVTNGIPVPSIRMDGIDDRLINTTMATPGGDASYTEITLFFVAAVDSNPGGLRAFAAGAPSSGNNDKDYVDGFNVDLGIPSSGSLDRVNLEGDQWPGLSDLLNPTFAIQDDLGPQPLNLRSIG